MGDGEQAHANPAGASILAGLQAGVIAALALLGWLALAGAWYRRSMWTAANIMSTNFYGEAGLSGAFTFRTVTGLALYVALYGIIGALFGLALASHTASRYLTMIGVLAGLGWYYLLFVMLWRNLNPLISLYTHCGPMIAGHVLYGALLGRFPRYFESPRHGG